MTKIRVYEFAQKLADTGLKVTSKDIIQKAGELGISLENHLSFLEETEVARLKRVFMDAQNQSQGQRVRGTIIRRRRPDGSDAGDGEPQGVVASAPAAPTPNLPSSVVRRRPAPEPVAAPAPLAATPVAEVELPVAPVAVDETPVEVDEPAPVMADEPVDHEEVVREVPEPVVAQPEPIVEEPVEVAPAAPHGIP